MGRPASRVGLAMSPDQTWFAERMMYFIPLVLSLSVHEWAHARAALALGDDTALHLGRVTFNPLAHIDPIGTLILPLLGVPFGWAKPVPFNPSRMRPSVSQTTGAVLVAMAGPASNIFLAACCAALLALGKAGVPGLDLTATTALLTTGIFLNLVLAVFNLIPIPPLDGSYLAYACVPRRYLGAWERYAKVAPLLLIFCVFILPQIYGIHLFQWVWDVANYIIRLTA